MAIDLRTRLFANHDLRDEVKRLAEAGTIRWSDEPFKLKSGIYSRIYVFGREDVTENPSLGRCLGHEIVRAAQEHLQSMLRGRELCAIGIPTAGTPHAAAASLGGSCAYRNMREAKKTHGAHSTWVNGLPDFERHVYFTIDNVITDGQSKLEAIEHLLEDGYRAYSMLHLTLVDRQQGGLERLQKLGHTAQAVFNLLDLVWAFGELRLWDKDRVKAVEDESVAHRALAS